ncbi:MAG: DUF1761 family protein [Candidatus Marinimicrobia bacterium]|nr:DUF1761 family protein [Candidatus Neomarinimicrobiota bacterium]
MNAKKLLMAWLAAFVVMFVVSFVWYNYIIAECNAEQFKDVLRAEKSMGLIAVGYLVISFLLAYVYPIGYQGGTPMSEGMRFGIIMGLIVAVPAALISAGAYNMPLGANIVDAIYRIVEITLGAMAMAVVYGDLSAAPEG